MIRQKYSYTRKYLLIFSILFLFSGCDIVDAIADVFKGNDDTDLSSQQEQALTTVLTLQDEASDIMENLFTSGLDTLSVIDSLASFFLSDTSIQYVWPDSEGVAVEYNNGISGGIFVGRYNSPIVEGSPPDTFIIELPYDGLQKRYVSNVSYSPLIKKSIYFDGAYTQFDVLNDDVINAANSSFAQVGIAPFVKYVDYEATLDVLSTLSEYGIIHLSGHGWHKYSGTGLWADKVTYLLTGEVAQVGKTYSDLWTDVLEKNIIIANYKGDNRYWVSPKFISDRNNFHDKETFFYNGICNGFRQPWRREIGINAGASAMVGYMYPVQPRWSYKWEMAMYRIMCDTSLEQPETIRNCIRAIIKGPRGYYDDGIVRRKYVHLKRGGNRDYTFWENELEMFGALIDVSVRNVTGRRRESYSGNGDWYDVEHQSLTFYDLDSGTHNSSGSIVNNVYTGTIDNYYTGTRSVSGNIQITFTDDNQLNLHIDRTETGNDVWDGGAWSYLPTTTWESNWTEQIIIDYDGVPGGWDITDIYQPHSLYPSTNIKKIVQYEKHDRSDSDIKVRYEAHGVIGDENWDVEYISHSYDGNPNHIDVRLYYK